MDTVVVTGASRGIGEAVARLFAEEGVHVVACAREAADVEAVVHDLESGGGSATGMRADVRDEFDLERLMETASRAGDTLGIDCVVAAAVVSHGAPGESPLADTSYSQFDDVLRTNARGVYATVREALPHLNDGARVLVTTDRAARDAAPGFGAYAVSKAAAEAICRQFAVELDRPIGVLDLGRVSTERFDDDNGCDPSEVAPMVWWAATEAAPEVLDGSVVDLDTWRAAQEE